MWCNFIGFKGFTLIQWRGFALKVILADEYVTTMSILVENKVGWLVDHQQEINKTYATTYVFENYCLSKYFLNRTDCVSERQTGYSLCRFKTLPELFAIHHTYVMDSHFTKPTKINQTSDNSYPVKRLGMSHSRSMMPSVLQLSVASKVNIFSIIFVVFVYIVP